MVGGWGAAVGTPVRVFCGAFGASSLFFVRLRNLKNLIELTKIRNNMDDCGCGSLKIPCLMSLAAGVGLGHGLGGLSCQLTTGLRSDKAVGRLCGVWRVVAPPLRSVLHPESRSHRRLRSNVDATAGLN